MEVSYYYDQFEGWGGRLDDTEKYRVNKTVSVIPNDVKSIIDIGCGDGRITNVLIGLQKIVGLDFSNAALKFVKCEKIRGSCVRVPLKDKSFDLALSNEVLEHLDQETFEMTTREIERIARKYILISVPYHQSLNQFKVKCGDCSYIYSLGTEAGEHVRSFNNDTLKSLFNKPFHLKYILYFGKSYNDPLLKLKHLLGYYYTSKYALCPKCSSLRTFSRKKDFCFKFLSIISWGLGFILLKRHPLYAICLYEKENKL